MRYMMLIYSREDEAATPEDRAAVFAAHQQVMDQTRARGIFCAADPLQPSVTATTVRVQDGQSLVTDGPFAETKEQLAGYYSLNCQDLEHAPRNNEGQLLYEYESRPSVIDDEMNRPFEDDRLSLIFTCCHPAINMEAQIGLTLRTLGGLTTPEIARAFLVPEATLAQRLVRAQRKIQQARIPFQVPDPGFLPERLSAVQKVL